jgi:hypothetical protein
MPHADPEKRKEYNRMRYEKKKEEIKEYRQEHKEEKAVYNKKYKKDNKEKIKEQQKKYDQTPAGKKRNTFAQWKERGLIHPDYDELYTRCLSTTICEVCRKEFENSYDRCMDHDHETGLFRQFLCRRCNIRDRWKNKV